MRTNKRVAVVGVDLGPTGDDAICDALRMMQTGALDTLHLLYIIDPKTVLDDGDRRALAYEEASLARAPSVLEKRVQELSLDLGIPVAADRVHGHGRLGDPAASLLQMCVDYEADLLIVGTNGRRGLDRWLEGSVAEQVVRGGHCPVLVARPKDYGGLVKTPRPDPAYARGEEPAHLTEREVSTQASTTLDSWAPSDNGPTGFRIV